MSGQTIVEVCVDSVASAVAAERGGAQRIELCSGLIEGGITPSGGLMEAARACVSIALHVMIRPRGGDFYYDENEFNIMRRDIETVQRLGADGVVVGLLTADGNIDIARTRQLVELAHPLQVTFHRAFDMSRDLFRALEDICAAGAHRILTSGGRQTSIEGVEMIGQLVRTAGNRIGIMAGSGIKPDNARMLVERTGVKEVHVGLRSSVSSPMRYRNPRISLGSTEGREYQKFVVLEDSVRQLCSAVSESVDQATEGS